MEKLCIIGTGSQARYIIDILKDSKEYTINGLVDLEKRENIGNNINNYIIKCFFKDIEKTFNPHKYKVIVAYGNNKKKKEIAKELSSMNYRFTSVISNKSYISTNVSIGKGCIINPNVTIMPNTKIGNNVIIHSGSVIEHDNIIENFVNIAPGVSTSGNVKIGEGSYIYTGTTIIPNINIGKWAIVGAGTTVVEDVIEKDIVVGNPARSIKK